MFTRRRRRGKALRAAETIQAEAVRLQAQQQVDEDARRAAQERERFELEVLVPLRREAEEAEEQRTEARKGKKRSGRRERAQRWFDAAAHSWNALLDNHLAHLLVGFSVAVAWVGQYRWLHDGLNLWLVVAAMGATVLEVAFTVAQRIVREAAKFHDPAWIARGVMWSVTGLAAHNLAVHVNPLMGAFSILGPALWELHQWWQRRKARYARGELTPRPRFRWDERRYFRDEVALAQRLAVRYGIAEPRVALAWARAELAESETRDHAAELRAALERFSRVVTAAAAANRDLVSARPADSLVTVPQALVAAEVAPPQGKTTPPSVIRPEDAESQQPADEPKQSKPAEERPTNVRPLRRPAGGGKREQGRVWFLQQVAEGRDPEDISAAEVDRAIGASGYSKKFIADWRSAARQAEHVVGE
ncbi:hypothetical protein GCM10012275_54790 [Longimycelium tulufanense]|uniref:DUF2637 domain-containing protein n=1 Tax=Longimycelium tulufanense TaxID=907463 RepID=A0A8J3CDA8_9PSEU|nr:hypothetical protein [Longimycelium tulufanense]GGM77188.1 hypothetical protein GCM10012275_54790 [Longimycelium tulufanense]